MDYHHDAARQLADTRDGLRRGARAAWSPPPWWYLVFTCGVATLIGATYDLPLDSLDGGWFSRQALMIAIEVVWVVVSRAVWWRGRPRPTILGSWFIVVFFVGLAMLYVLATLAGLGLRAHGVPLPFTLAGFASGVVLTVGILLAFRPLHVAYLKRVESVHW